MKDLIAKNKTVEAVYVFAIDRLARKVSVILSVKDYLLERNINLVFVNPHKMATLRKDEKGNLVEDELTSMLLMFLSYGAEMKYKIHNASVNWIKIDFTVNRENIVYEPLYLKHYITKSFEEFCWKVYVRGMFHNGHRKFQSLWEMDPNIKQKVYEDKNFKQYFYKKYGVYLIY